MVGLLRRLLDRFNPVTTADVVPALPQAAVGGDRVVRAGVASRPVGGFGRVAVRRVEVRAATRDIDPAFGPVRVTAVPLARLAGTFGPLAEAATAARERAAAEPDAGPLRDPDDLCRRDLFAFPVLPAEETRALLREVAAMGPVVRTEKRRRRAVPEAARPRFVELRNRLVCGHLRLCADQVNALPPVVVAACGWADLVQEAVTGLARAIELFDPTRGLELSTYAFPWIRNAIGRAVRRDSRLVRVPDYLQTGPKRLPAQELARFGRWVRLGENLPDPRAVEPGERVAAEEARAARRQVVGEVLSTLPMRLITIVRKRYGLADGREMTLQEIADEVGLTRERIRQLEVKALQQLGTRSRRDRLEAVSPI